MSEMIWAWHLPLTTRTVHELSMPVDSKVVALAWDEKNRVISLWAKFPSHLRETAVPRRFSILSTGAKSPEVSMYVGTVVDHRGDSEFGFDRFVWHVYEVD